MRKCALSVMPDLLRAVAEATPLYLPVDTDKGDALFTRWFEGADWSGACNTARGPKDLFFPQTEDLVAFKTAGKTVEVLDIRREQEDFVVFGVRPCDVKAIEVLDRVFLSEPVDSFYAARRNHALIVTAACSRPTETCFCGTFGIDPTALCGDVTVWKTEDHVYWQAATEQGERFLAALDGFLEDADDTAVTAQRAQTAALLSRLPLHSLRADAFGGGKTEAFFDHPAWDTLSQSCLGCGTCTFVCPTCQCYDIKDFDTGHGVVRYRCWDSCMYSDFTKMAHGNPRLTQKERFRQRFMHKLVYYPENNDGLFSCVGCGRCLAKCPISMNIATVMNTLGGDAR
ncbi:MAG: 4Fe-4S dicluster domain-containing protein [Clostridia bacterium]|nr:4Fe-4S dicluster domain-containing protein [Clostridia bacterium]